MNFQKSWDIDFEKFLDSDIFFEKFKILGMMFITIDVV
jgi:hypothetical protein